MTGSGTVSVAAAPTAPGPNGAPSRVEDADGLDR
jgi:hypothetical protein